MPAYMVLLRACMCSFVRARRVHMSVWAGGCRLVAQVKNGAIARLGGSQRGPDARVSQMAVGWDKGKHGWDARCK